MTEEEYLAKLALVGRLRQRAAPRNERAAARVRGFGEGLTGEENPSGALDNPQYAEDARAGFDAGNWTSIGSDMPGGALLGGAKSLAMMVPFIRGLNKVPKIAADLEKRALSAEQHFRKGSDPDLMRRDVGMEVVPRTDPHVRTPMTGKFQHEVETPTGDAVIRTDARMLDKHKIDALSEWGMGGGGEDAFKVLDRWTVDDSPVKKLRQTTARWHRNPADQWAEREKKRRLLDAEPGAEHVLANLRNMESAVLPVAGSGKLGDAVDMGELFQQYPELANRGLKIFPDMSLPSSKLGMYDIGEKTLEVHPGAMLGSRAAGEDPVGIIGHELSHGIADMTNSPQGLASGLRLNVVQRQQMEDISKVLRKDNDPTVQRLGQSILVNANASPHQQYLNNFGEAGARISGKRMHLTQAEREARSTSSMLDTNKDGLWEWQTQGMIKKMLDPNDPMSQQTAAEQAEFLVDALRRFNILR